MLTLLSAQMDIDGKLQLTIRISPDPRVGSPVRYIAAVSADRRSSMTGSGLPFANEHQAFENTPNKGEISWQGGDKLSLVLPSPPNAYYTYTYTSLGLRLIPPALHVVYFDDDDKEYQGIVMLEDVAGIPYRGLTYPEGRRGPEFYITQPQVTRSQDQILRDSAYPATYQRSRADFWHGKPPC